MATNIDALIERIRQKNAGQALFMQGIVLLKLDRNGEAVALFEDMRRELPGHPLFEDAFYWQGMGYSFDGEHELTSNHLEDYLNRFPQGRYRPVTAIRDRANQCGTPDRGSRLYWHQTSSLGTG